jgi:RNAse (barnase) inhibitor barstar
MNKSSMSGVMQAVAEVLAQPNLNGVYRLSQSIPGFKPALDGRLLSDKHALLAAVGRALDFPDYYGNNWDALEECLTDLDMHPTALGLLIEQADAIPGTVLDTFLEVFLLACQQSAESGRPCSLLLCGLENEDIPLLA